MNSPSVLWQQYFEAVRAGKQIEAQRILNMLHSYKGTPTPSGGCSSCNRRFL